MRAEREALSLIHFLRDQEQPQSEWLNALSSDQTISTSLCPHYGKIDRESLKLRLEAETQEIKMLVTTDAGYEFRRGDIIGSDSLNHVKLSPGSKVVRHLPSGGQELMP